MAGPRTGAIDCPAGVTCSRSSRDLVNELQTRGWKEVPWDGRNSEGERTASGVYFCKLQTSQESEIIRMVLLK